MSYLVKLTRRAKKSLDKLDEKTKKKINKSLSDLIDYFEGKCILKPDLKLLKGKYSGLFRLRVGNYRIIFTMQRSDFVILMIEIVDRKDAYK